MGWLRAFGWPELPGPDDLKISRRMMIMADSHRNFVLDMMMRIGAPIFSGTLVACLLRDDVKVLHIALMSLGITFMWVGHRATYHSG